MIVPTYVETYKNIDLYENPIIVLKCGHFFTIRAMDVIMEFNSFYIKASNTQ